MRSLTYYRTENLAWTQGISGVNRSKVRAYVWTQTRLLTVLWFSTFCVHTHFKALTFLMARCKGSTKQNKLNNSAYSWYFCSRVSRAQGRFLGGRGQGDGWPTPHLTRSRRVPLATNHPEGYARASGANSVSMSPIFTFQADTQPT